MRLARQAGEFIIAKIELGARAVRRRPSEIAIRDGDLVAGARISRHFVSRREKERHVVNGERAFVGVGSARLKMCSPPVVTLRMECVDEIDLIGGELVPFDVRSIAMSF